MRRRVLGLREGDRKLWAKRKQQMHCDSPVLAVRINNIPICALYDTGCESYALVSEEVQQRLSLPLVDKKKREMSGFREEDAKGTSSGIAVFDLEASGYVERVFAHVIPGLTEEMFLGTPWMRKNSLSYDAGTQRIHHGRAGVNLRLVSAEEPPSIRAIRNARIVPAAIFAAECRRVRKSPNRGDAMASVMAISLADIEKALNPEPAVDPAQLIPAEIYKDFAQLFSRQKADELPPRRPGIDVAVNLQRTTNGEEKPMPWGPLYSMSREELLVLRKTLTELLDKGFIRASSSSAAAPVLFVKKPGGGIRMCVDYRALNAITERDRYPLPLVSETLRSMAAARWYTKLDVVAAFHKMRIKEGHEERTAFRTRYGLYEWIVCPFGLSNAPAAFQRFINSVLRPFLDDFATAYMDDILIFSDGSRQDHIAKVRRVLKALAEAGLYLDPKKCAFATKEVKYIGFIIKAGEGIACDPEKLRAIREWEAPSQLKGVRSFLGFCNYYRNFIPNFTTIAEPLLRLTKKDVPFQWDNYQEEAFQRLKKCFEEVPILAPWDPEKKTIVEADCSGFATGGVLSQENSQGVRRPVAYTSKKLSPAEYNYEIHDKELLAIIRCLEAWRPELRSCDIFTILTDHKNLEYFMTKQKLSERQVRWAEKLAEFQFNLSYRPGSENAAADALSRREQDMPKLGDTRERGRLRQLLPTAQVRRVELARVSKETIFEDKALQDAWNKEAETDAQYKGAITAIHQRLRSFPPELGIKVQLSECDLDERGHLRFRGRTWIPRGEGEVTPLRTQVIQKTHDSVVVGHPGRDGTLAAISRRFFWPGIGADVRRFQRNCDHCGRGHIWRERKRGLLKPLPISQRPRTDLAMDFITDLPPTGKEGCRYLWVIVDRFTKAVTLEAMPSMEAEACAQRFLSCHFRFHGMPRSIVSDRGTNWVSRFWRHFCALAGIEQRLSTSYHPQTDGATERANQEVEAFLRHYIDYSQGDWGSFLPATQLALNNRAPAATQLSPFFLEHGYHIEPFAIKEDIKEPTNSFESAAEALLSKQQAATEFVAAALAEAQQRNEDAANRQRTPAEEFRVGDKVWLDLRNYRSPRPSKKLDALHRKYEVTKVISSHVVELNVPSAIYPRFHVDLLRRAPEDPLPGQLRDDSQPPPIQVDGEDEWEVEAVEDARTKRRGRGYVEEVLVKWRGYAERTWEPRADLQDTSALAAFEDQGRG